MLTSQMDGPATSRPRSRPGRDMPSTSRNDHPADADKGGHPNGHPTTHAADPERPFRRCRRPHLPGGDARRGRALVRRLPGRPGVAAWILRHPVRVADFFERAFERYSAPTRAEVSLRRRTAIRPSRTPAGPPPRLSEDPRYDPAF